MPSWIQRLKGNLFLGYCALVAHPAKKWLRSRPLSGEDRFLRNYAIDGDVVTSADDRFALAGAQRCIQCGLCDAYAPEDTPLAPSTLSHAFARAARELRFARTALQRLMPEAFREAERCCPRAVPLVLLATRLKRKLEQVDAASGTGKAP